MMDFGPVKEWLFSVETVMRRIFATSNVYNCLHTVYEELGVFGTAAVCIETDFENVIRGYPYTAGEFMLANGADLSIDTLFREFSLTVGQVVEQLDLPVELSHQAQEPPPDAPGW